jgi:hypothetical protein
MDLDQYKSRLIQLFPQKKTIVDLKLGLEDLRKEITEGVFTPISSSSFFLNLNLI